MNDTTKPSIKRRLEGVVTSTAMDKTAVIRVGRVKVHPLYHKRFTTHAKYKAHDPKNEAAVGDTVIIEETRPLSRTKRWKIVETVKKAA